MSQTLTDSNVNVSLAPNPTLDGAVPESRNVAGEFLQETRHDQASIYSITTSSFNPHCGGNSALHVADFVWSFIL